MFEEDAILNSDNVDYDPGGWQSVARVKAVLDILRRPKLLRRRVIPLIEQSVECLDHKRFVGFLLGFHNSDFVKDVFRSSLIIISKGCCYGMGSRYTLPAKYIICSFLFFK